MPDPDLAAQRAVVDAFFAAARGGDLDGLVAVLDPDVVLRSDVRPGILRGAAAVAAGARGAADPRSVLLPALVAGRPGVVVTLDGRAVAVLSFTVTGGRITAVDAVGRRSAVERLVRL